MTACFHMHSLIMIQASWGELGLDRSCTLLGQSTWPQIDYSPLPDLDLRPRRCLSEE